MLRKFLLSCALALLQDLSSSRRWQSIALSYVFLTTNVTIHCTVNLKLSPRHFITNPRMRLKEISQSLVVFCSLLTLLTLSVGASDDPDCVEKGMCIGEPLVEDEAESMEGCQSACAANPECQHFSFDREGTTNLCFMFKECPGLDYWRAGSYRTAGKDCKLSPASREGGKKEL